MEKQVDLEELKSDPMVIILEDPISWGSETIRHVKFRKPKGKDLRKLPSEPTLNDLLRMAARLTEQPDGVFSEMGSKDCIKVAEFVGELL